MADVINIERGFSPWQPSADAHLAKQYQYYEFPMAGVIEQHGTRYFFICIDGADEPVNLWFYGRLSPEDEAKCDQADATDFDSAVDFSGPAVLALAVEGPGIVASTVMGDVNSEELKQAHRTLYEQLQMWARAAEDLQPA